MRTNVGALLTKSPNHEHPTPKEASLQKDLQMIDRDMAVAGIRTGLRRRSNRAWSPTAGRGTVANWITIIAPPARLGPGASMTPEDCTALARLLGLDCVHPQGVMIEPDPANWDEYLTRARGRDPHRAELGQAGPPNAMPSRGPRPIGGLRSLASPDERGPAL